MQTFYEWLQQYRMIASPIGDLARAAYLDRSRPQANSLPAWEEHITAMGGSYDALELLRKAWEQYESGVAPSPDSRSYRLRRDDERWTIKRPALPNWISTLPALVQVRITRPPDDKPTNVQTVSSQVFCSAVEQIGRYFRREFRYDFLPYTVREHHKEGDAIIQPYLFFDHSETNDVIMRPIGACGFWYRGCINEIFHLAAITA